MEPTEDKSNISSNDLQNLSMTVSRIMNTIGEDNSKILSNFHHIMRGLSSHHPDKRSGYAIVLSELLSHYKDQIDDEEALAYLTGFNFSKKSTKSSLRTSSIAMTMAVACFIRSGVLRSDKSIIQAMMEIAQIAINRPYLQGFAYYVLAELIVLTEYKYLDNVLDYIQLCLDAYIFWFKIAPECPEEYRHLLPEQFQKTTYNDQTAEMVLKMLQQTKQPWNSPIWAFLLSNIETSDLLTFWPLVIERYLRNADQSGKFAVVMIVKSVFPSLKPDQYSIVISSTFIKLLNTLLTQPMVQDTVTDFLAFAHQNVKDSSVLLNHFAYIDARLPGGFSFHKKLFKSCLEEQLQATFEQLVHPSPNDLVNFRVRTSVTKDPQTAFDSFRFDKLRAMFLGTSNKACIKLTQDIFDHFFVEFRDRTPQLATDLIKFDKSRHESAASFRDLLKDPEANHFDCCYKLYSLCSGVSSSPSLDTVIPPTINDSEASADFILVATQHARDPPLIRYAFQSYLGDLAPLIPIQKIQEFLAECVPAADTFNTDTIDTIDIALKKCTFSMNIMAPLFSLFCKVLTNCGPIVAQHMAEVVKTASKRESGDFSFHTVLKSLFQSMSSLPNRIVTQHERLIYPVFMCVLANITKAVVPFSPKVSKALTTQIDEAVQDFAFKSNPHFGEEIFSGIAELPGNAATLFLPVILKHLPKVKRIHRRAVFFGLVTTILSTPRGLETLGAKGDEFNACCSALLAEEPGNSKEDEKKLLKSMYAINKWLTLIEKRRISSAAVNVAALRRKIQILQTVPNDTVAREARLLSTTLQKVEGTVPAKQRVDHDF